MGIRINKSLGWVLTGVELDLEVLESLTLGDLKKENPQDFELNHLDLSYPNLDLSQKLINFVRDVSDEYKEGDRMYVFSPPFVGKEWHRHDDTIDYYEADSGERKVKYLHGEIFPYAQKFVVTSSLKELNEVQTKTCWYFSEQADKFKPELKKEFTDLGIDLTQPIKPQIHMICPHVIRLILKKCSDVDYKILQPGIVTYWG